VADAPEDVARSACGCERAAVVLIVRLLFEGGLGELRSADNEAAVVGEGTKSPPRLPPPPLAESVRTCSAVAGVVIGAELDKLLDGFTPLALDAMAAGAGRAGGN
jgi:hypothetical protein